MNQEPACYCLLCKRESINPREGGQPCDNPDADGVQCCGIMVSILVCQRCKKKTTDQHRGKYCEYGDDPQGKNEHRWMKS